MCRAGPRAEPESTLGENLTGLGHLGVVISDTVGDGGGCQAGKQQGPPLQGKHATVRGMA